MLAHPRGYPILSHLPRGLGWSSCPQGAAGSCCGYAGGGQGAVRGMAQGHIQGTPYGWAHGVPGPVNGVAVQSLASALYPGVLPSWPLPQTPGGPGPPLCPCPWEM